MNLTNADIKNLKDKRYRKDNGFFMVEGNKFCKDLLSQDIEIVYTITTDKNLLGFPNIVLVSEYEMPEDGFECIWQKQVKVAIDSNKKANDLCNYRTEKLFICR